MLSTAEQVAIWDKGVEKEPNWNDYIQIHQEKILRNNFLSIKVDSIREQDENLLFCDSIMYMLARGSPNTTAMTED